MFHLEFPFSFPFDPFAFGIFDDFWICLVGFCYCLLVSCDGLFFLTDSIFDIRVWRLKWRPALMFFFLGLRLRALGCSMFRTVWSWALSFW
jgi:hypothetical protein